MSRNWKPFKESWTLCLTLRVSFYNMCDIEQSANMKMFSYSQRNLHRVERTTRKGGRVQHPRSQRCHSCHRPCPCHSTWLYGHFGIIRTDGFVVVDVDSGRYACCSCRTILSFEEVQREREKKIEDGQTQTLTGHKAKQKNIHKSTRGHRHMSSPMSYMSP